MMVLIMSDIHGNIEALKSVKKVINQRNIDAMILLGDIIDYGPQSNEVIRLIQELPYKVICNIRGNHEEAISKEQYERFSSERGRECARHTRDILDKNSWDYINNVMDSNAIFEFEVAGKKCLAVHGGLEDNYWKAITLGTDFSAYVKYDYVFSGHSHLPHTFAEYYPVEDKAHRNKKRTMFINPGSVGQPRNHNPRAQFVLWDTKTDSFEMCCVDYDIKKEQKAFSNAVDNFYKERLEVGV